MKKYKISQKRVLDRLKEIYFITAYEMERKADIIKKFDKMRMKIIDLFRDLGGDELKY
jgi:hypothetical protein